MIVSMTFFEGLLLPAVSLLVLFLPVLPLWRFVEGARLVWLPIVGWVVGWLVLVSTPSLTRIYCQQLPQDNFPAVAVARLVALLGKRCMPRALAQRCEDVFERFVTGSDKVSNLQKQSCYRCLPSLVLPLNAILFTADDLFLHVVDALAVLTVAVALSVLQVRLGAKWWGPISEMEQPVAIVLVDLFWRCARRGRSRELGFTVFCIVVTVHWIAKLKGPENE